MAVALLNSEQMYTFYGVPTYDLWYLRFILYHLLFVTPLFNADSHTESRTKAKTAGGETKRLDLGGDVEAHWRESLHAPGPAVREGGQDAVLKSGASELGEGPTEEGGRGGGGGGGSGEGGPASYPRGVVPPSVVV